MKTILLLAALLLPACAGVSAGGAMPPPLPAEIRIDGIPCLGQPTLHRNGRVRTCTLARDHWVAGCQLPAHSRLEFNADGTLREGLTGAPLRLGSVLFPAQTKLHLRGERVDAGILTADAVVNGVELPAGSTIFFRNPWEQEVPGTWHCWLAKETQIQGIRCGAHQDGCGIVFYRSGRLRSVGLQEDRVIDGIPCTSRANPLRMPWRVLAYGTDRKVWFFENGRLEQAMLADDCEIQGRAFRRGDIVRLKADGTLHLGAPTLGARSRRD